MIELRRFTDPAANNSDVTRLVCHGVEATAAQEAGADGGRVLGVIALEIASPGIANQALALIGDAAYATVRASLTSDTGPWTDLDGATIPDATPTGETIQVWLQPLAKRWGSSTPYVRPIFRCGFRARRPVNWLG